MATLDPGNVINGNTIEASDIAQLYKAFGTGSGATITGLSMTGSITNANVATSATSASNITTAVVNTGTHYITFVTGSGTNAPKIDNDLEYNASTNILTVTASFATTASFASNSSVTQVNGQFYDDGTTTIPADFKFVAGKVAMTSGAATSSVFTNLINKVIGNTVWINASYPEVFSTSPGQSLLKVNVSASGQVLISGAPGDTGTIIFTGIYI